ncbi:hypothetical protein HPB50_015199 [Hyalomma asiaticum]|uniref:Uncharacterized protein n=1 Tax=Hyalomma asiaticum TaxID=266040 RepID=A0ACB7SQS0_HYAAI|nr:hypothetical protein HPB50_015199 [Hyalomma asiaticum]
MCVYSTLRHFQGNKNCLKVFLIWNAIDILISFVCDIALYYMVQSVTSEDETPTEVTATRRLSNPKKVIEFTEVLVLAMFQQSTDHDDAGSGSYQQDASSSSLSRIAAWKAQYAQHRSRLQTIWERTLEMQSSSPADGSELQQRPHLATEARAADIAKVAPDYHGTGSVMSSPERHIGDSTTTTPESRSGASAAHTPKSHKGGPTTPAPAYPRAGSTVFLNKQERVEFSSNVENAHDNKTVDIRASGKGQPDNIDLSSSKKNQQYNRDVDAEAS